ncbi:MAG: hypothetical protein ACRD8W_29620, partial [Nitrososphaeraceae archaeon]
MPRIKSYYICSVCGSAGGTFAKRAVRDTVHIPRFLDILPDVINGKEGFKIVNHIKTIPEAMDFVAKISLRVEEYFIVNPPPGTNDDKFADLIYAELTSSSYGIHTKDQIKKFEERHIHDNRPLERIKKREMLNFERSVKNAVHSGSDFGLPVSSP